MHTFSNATCNKYPRDTATGTLELDLAHDPGDEQELLFGGIARKISRTATQTVRKVGKTVGKTAKASRPVWKTAGKAVKSAHRLTTPAGVVPLARFGRDLAQGKNVWRSVRRAGRGVVNDVRAKLRYARIAAPFVPGVGTGVAAALGAADALASGRSITDAAIAAARSAVPGGAIAQTAFDVGLNLAQGRSLSTAALAAARRRLPGGPAARAAFDTAVALGRGKSLQAAARRGSRGMRLYSGTSRFLNRPTKSRYWRTRMRTMRGSARELEGTAGLELDIELPDEESFFSKIKRPRPIALGTNIPPYTQCDFIHENIDVSAQYALYGMLKADAASRNASIKMLAAVKTGRLGGIYQEDQKVPALRAIKLGLGWYRPLIDKYRKSASGAACIPPAAHSSHKLEIISFKKSLAKNITELGQQLRNVWLECAASKLPLPQVLPQGIPCPKQPKSEPCKTEHLYQYLSICDANNDDCLKQLWTYANGDPRFPIYCRESPECRNRCHEQRQGCQEDARSQSKCPLPNDPYPVPASGGFEFETSRQSPFLGSEEDEWSGKTNRSSRDYVRWIQSSLNQILGLRLKADGIMGPQTKNTIRSFQRKYGLAIDGIVGIKTERAVKSALTGKKSPAIPTSPPQILQQIPPNTTIQAPERIDKFDKDSSQLKSSHYTAIDRIAHRIALSWRSGTPIPTVYVKGHSSSEGKAQHNMGLGQRRALAVRNALMKALENQQKNLSYKVLILAKSKGETNPIASNNTEKGRSANRRVETFLSTKVLLPITPPVPTPPAKIKPAYIWPNLDLSGPVPQDPLSCNKKLYKKLKDQALKKLINGIGSCVAQYIDRETSSLDTALTTLGTALTALAVPAVGVPIAVVVGIVGGLSVSWKSARAKQAAIDCAISLANNYNNQLQLARNQTHCL